MTAESSRNTGKRYSGTFDVVAERLGSGLQNRVPQFNPGRRLYNKGNYDKRRSDSMAKAGRVLAIPGYFTKEQF